MAGRTSRKSTKVSRQAAAKRTLKKAAAPRKAVARTPAAMSAAQRIDKLVADLGDWRGERLAEIRALIHEVDPEVVEEWKWMGSPVWSHDGMYALANAHTVKVELTFFHGAQLSDPGKLFNTGFGGNTWRAIDFREGDQITRPRPGNAMSHFRGAIVSYSTMPLPVSISAASPCRIAAS